MRQFHDLNFRRLSLCLVIGLTVLVLSACGAHSGPTAPPPELPTMPPTTVVTPTPASAASPVTATAGQQPTTASTPLPATPITRLTDPGCCAQPFWAADSSMVLFLDKPEPTSATAIYGVPIAGGAPQVISETVGIPSPDGHYLTFQNDNHETMIRDTSSGEEWALDSGGRRPFFSPTSKRVAWANTIEESSSDFSKRRTVISTANVDGSDAHETLTVYGGGIGGWLDDDHLLLTGRIQQDDPDVQIFSFNLNDNSTFSIVHENMIRNVNVGPGGQWLLYTVALDPSNSANDGLWIVKSDASQRFRLEVVGGARWRDPTHLLIIPLDSGAPSHRLWQFDTATGQAVPITNPDVSPFRVAGGDWSVSPDGKYVVFVNAQDQALYLIALPPES